MQEFKEWLSSRDHNYYKSFVISEQGNVPATLPQPVESPPGSGRFFYKIPDPDQPGKMISIDATSRTGEKRATELLARSAKQPGTAPAAPAAPGTAGAVPAAPVAVGSLINPIVSGNEVDIGGGTKINLNTRNIMLKREIAEKLKKPYRNLTDDEVNWQIAYMANENGLTDFMKINGEKTNLKKLQQAYVDRYGYTPEEQMARGATKEMTRISPKDWTGINVKASRLGRRAVPKGATVVPASPLDTKEPLSKELESLNRDRLALKNSYGPDPSKWQLSARVAAEYEKGDPIQAGRFMNYFYDKNLGPDYTKWNAAQQKEAGVDLSVPYTGQADVKEMPDEQKIKDTPFLNLFQMYEKQPKELENVFKKKIELGVDFDRLSIDDLYTLTYAQTKLGMKDLISPDQAKKMLERKDLNKPAIDQLNKIAGSGAAPAQAPAAEKPTGNEDKLKQLENQIKSISDELKKDLDNKNLGIELEKLLQQYQDLGGK